MIVVKYTENMIENPGLKEELMDNFEMRQLKGGHSPGQFMAKYSILATTYKFPPTPS